MLADPDVISWILKSLIIFGHMTVCAVGFLGLYTLNVYDGFILYSVWW